MFATKQCDEVRLKYPTEPDEECLKTYDDDDGPISSDTRDSKACAPLGFD